MKRSPFSLFTARHCGMALLLSAAVALINSCATGGGGAGPDYGPFDSNGNYVEEWADNPSKWRRNPAPPPPVNDTPTMASNDTPPKNLTPLPTGSSTIESARVTTTAPQTMPKPRTTTPTVTRTTPKPKPTVTRVTPKPKPKPRPVVAKPSGTRVTVKKGDTLYGLALRYKSSVSAIQKANGISGTNLKIGKTLLIPRK